MRLGSYFAVAFALAFSFSLSVLCSEPSSPPPCGAPGEAAAGSLPPLYLGVFMHNEEPVGGRPDYTANRDYYLKNRALLKAFVETVRSHGAAFNFQSDWNYLKAVALFETPDVTADTGGKNIVRWMSEDMGVEVDPHAHETQYNYADVAYLLDQIGVPPSKTVGGFLYDPPDNPQGWEQHEAGIFGRVYPTYFWKADLLWGAATAQHQGNDDKSSGVWRPKDRAHFTQDDPNRRLLYLGAGCGSQQGVIDLLSRIENGTAPADGFYTATFGFAQDWITQGDIDQLGAFIDSLAPKVQSGFLQWKTIQARADLWRNSYGGRAFRYDCASGTGSTYTTESVEAWVTDMNGSNLYARLVRPNPSLYPGQRFPVLIMIPGGTGDGAPFADVPNYKNLAASGFVLVAFNLPGRGNGGPGNLTSGGVQNCNGFLDQDALRSLVLYVSALPEADPTNIGIESNSYGIATASGCLGRYPDLPVAYYIDVEGPHDSRVVTFYDAGHEKASCGHMSLLTDPSAENQAFWAEREAVRFIGKYPGRYLRMQAYADHTQNPGYFRHAIEMIDAATRTEYGGAGICPWTRMNGSDVGNPVNTSYDFADPSAYPNWITGKISADHPGLDIVYVKEMAALVASKPSCAVTKPSDGSSASCDLAIEASANDPSGVASVELFVDGAKAATLDVPPYAMRWDTRDASNGSHFLSARACGISGNCAESAAVRVTVANPLPKQASYRSSSRAITIDGENFATGATVFINGLAKATVWKSASEVKAKGVTWKRGTTIAVRVANADGCSSKEVSFAR